MEEKEKEHDATCHALKIFLYQNVPFKGVGTDSGNGGRISLSFQRRAYNFKDFFLNQSGG